MVSNSYAFRQFLAKITYKKKTAVIPESYRTCRKETFVVSGHLAQSEPAYVQKHILTGLTTDCQSWSVRSDTFSSGGGPRRYCSVATGSFFGGTFPFCLIVKDKHKTVNLKVTAFNTFTRQVIR